MPTAGIMSRFVIEKAQKKTQDGETGCHKFRLLFIFLNTFMIFFLDHFKCWYGQKGECGATFNLSSSRRSSFLSPQRICSFAEWVLLTGDVDHPRSQFVALTSRTEGCVCWLAYGADLTCRGAAGIQRCLRWLARFLKAAALLSLPPVVFYVSAIIDVFGLVRGMDGHICLVV